MSKIWPAPTILDLGRLVAAIDMHRGALDEFALAYKTPDDKKVAVEDARDCLQEAILILQDEALGAGATSLAEAAIQAEFAWLKANVMTGCELNHQFAKGTLEDDLKLLHRALASIVLAVSKALPDAGKDVACARGIVDPSATLCTRIVEAGA